jgi:hypothetical protein
MEPYATADRASVRLLLIGAERMKTDDADAARG